VPGRWRQLGVTPVTARHIRRGYLVTPASRGIVSGRKFVYAAYVTATVLTSVLTGSAAVTYLMGHEYPKSMLDMKRLPRSWMPMLGILLVAGALGLLAGFVVRNGHCGRHRGACLVRKPEPNAHPGVHVPSQHGSVLSKPELFQRLRQPQRGGGGGDGARTLMHWVRLLRRQGKRHALFVSAA